MENAVVEKLVVFVCTGNTCRSPMAEAIFRYEAKRRGLPLIVRSAGLEASASGSMHLYSLRTLANHGLSIENFTPTPLSEQLMREAAAIVCMTEQQKELAAYCCTRVLGAEGAQKVYAFSDFCGYSIPDPYGQGVEVYEDTYKGLEGGMSALIDFLFPQKPLSKSEKSTAKKKEAVKDTEKTATKKKTAGARKGRPKKEKITE
ncbi:MAG: hypothetical protein IJF39_04590 [Clostridia bacterium]|nr:hypothetical protein [Clostridia bacterium]